MKIRKSLSIIVVSFMVLPLFTKSVNAETVLRLCLNSGIIGYYNSISKATFDMAHKILHEAGVSVGQNSKKETPAKKETKQNNDIQAVILDNASKKLVKTVLFFTPVFYETLNNADKFALSIDSGFIFTGWMLLFVLACIFSIRKKDDYEASLNYNIERRPIVL